MELYLSEELLKFTLKGFRALAEPGEIKQGATQNISAIRHCLALDKLLNKHSIDSVKLQHKTDQHLEEFIKYVGDIVRLDQNGIYTTNLINDIKNVNDFGVGSNLISAGVATHSIKTVQRYPKKSNKGLISIKNYHFSLLNDYINTLTNIYNIKNAGFAFLIWLNRFNSFDEEITTPEQLFNELKKNIDSEYSSDLAKLLSFSDSKHFAEQLKNIGPLLSKTQPDLISLFNQVHPRNQPTPRKSIFSNKTQLPKPFLLLAGISGTGKSRFVRQQAAKAAKVGSPRDRENYELVAVRPDWHEPSDLLGYVSRLSGTAEYVATPVLRFIVKAWQELLDKGCTLPDENRTLDDVLLSGTCEQLDAVLPYWLCLDEMNLAPVEQYFADYLALIETRKWEWPDNADGFEYSCDALLAASTLTALEDDAQKKLAAELGLEKESKLWKHFLQHGIAIPPNLIVAGTVNMDETTHGFSRKVIDRAMSFDFGEFFPNDFDDFYTSSISQVPLTFPRYSSGKEALDDTDAKASIEFLQAINAVLKNTPFELAYRALNELLLAVHCHDASDNDADLQAVWDDFLMQKVLPRIEGDADKLQQDNQGNLLARLQEELETQLVEIWADDKTRTDFYRMQNDAPMQIPCRSRQKIQWMQQRLESSGFTSFWP